MRQGEREIRRGREIRRKIAVAFVRAASRCRFLDRERARGVRRGCANRCVGPFPPAGTQELRERRFPSPPRGLSNGARGCLPLGGDGLIVWLLWSSRGPPFVGRSASNTERPPMEESSKTANPKRFRIQLCFSTAEDEKRPDEKREKERKRERTRAKANGEAERCDSTSISERLRERGMQSEGWNTSVLKMATWVPRWNKVVLAIL